MPADPATDAPSPNDPPLQLRLLGVPEARWRGAPVVPPTRKALATVAYTALRGGCATRDELAELLWGAAGRRNVRQALHRLRALPGADAWLEAGETVRVHADTDVAAFEAALADGDAARAVALHDGRTLLEGLNPRAAPAFEAWLEEARARLQGRFAEALRTLAGQQERAGQAAEALATSRRLRSLDPLDEANHRRIMRLAWGAGDVQAAWRAYEECRRTLREELGVDPTEPTQRLARAAFHGRRDTRRRARRVRRGAPPPMPRALLRPPVLAGREAAWRQLAATCREGRVAVLSGPAGIGKTRLMMDYGQARGRILLASGHAGDDAVPLASFTRALRDWFEAVPELQGALPPWVRREAARLVPLSDAAPPEPVGSEEERARFAGAMTELIRRVTAHADLIGIDDLHAFDDASRDLMLRACAELSARHAGGAEAHAHLVACLRSDEPTPALARALARQEGAGTATRVPLAPLDPDGVAALLDGMGYPGGALAAALHRHAGGTPQLLIEVLKDLHERDRLPPDADEIGAHGVEGALPARAGAMIGGRLARLPAAKRALLEVLAVLGTPVEAEVLAAALDRPEAEVRQQVARLEARQFLEAGRPAHELLRDTVLSSLAEPARRGWHRRIAHALEARGATPARIAHHAWEAGAPAWAHARWLEAAERAHAQGATEQARTWLADLAASDDVSPQLRARALLRLGRLRIDRDVAAAGADVQRALDLARSVHDVALEPWCLLAAADVATFAGSSDQAAARLGEARSLAREVLEEGERDALVQAATGVAWALGDFAGTERGIHAALARQPRAREPRLNLAMLRWHQGRFREAAAQLTALLRDDPDAAQVTLLYHDLGVAQWTLGRLDRAAWYLQRSREVWDDSGNTYAEAMTAMAWGTLDTSRARLDAAEQQLRRARELFEAQGNHVRSADVDVRLAHVAHHRGHDADARSLCDRAQARLADVHFPYLTSYLHALSAVNHARRGHAACAQREAATALDEARETRHGLALVLAYRAVAEVALLTNDAATARAHACCVTSLARRHEMPEHMGHGLLLEARARADDAPGGAAQHARHAWQVARAHDLAQLASAVADVLPTLEGAQPDRVL
ncbi:MAG: BTAD domain-containing putative transcriptional regulator [Trueperaceae bacterium]|nr:BTAD domain-containing putative transcriptional regulator [Trueperaceae bacterium]